MVPVPQLLVVLLRVMHCDCHEVYAARIDSGHAQRGYGAKVPTAETGSEPKNIHIRTQPERQNGSMNPPSFPALLALL